MMKKLIFGAFALLLLAGINFLSYRAARGSNADAWSDAAQKSANTPPVIRQGAADLLWLLLEQTKVDTHTHQIVYSENLKTCTGKKVRIRGVLCVLPNLVVDGKVQSCVLMPPSKIACCGISCDPRPELMIFVDCKSSPFAPPSQKRMAEVSGELELQNDDASWCLYTLNSAQVTLLP